MKTGTLLRMALAAVWLWCSQSVRAAETFSDPEGSPAEMDFFSWEKLQEKAKENQENFRKRVAIPEAVGPELKVENGARPASLAAPLELQPETLLFAAMFFLAAMLAVPKFAPRLADAINTHFNPWAPLPSAAANRSSNVLAEDDIFAEFLTDFQNGPSMGVSRRARITERALVAAGDRSQPSEQLLEMDGHPVKEFLVGAPDYLAALRKSLQEFGRGARRADPQKMLSALRDQIRKLKGMTGLHELLPVWQMASALEGLLKQLLEKASNITPSTLRTVAGGVDLLEELCRPGLRPDLCTSPPVRLLAVDDDPISRHAISFSLKKGVSTPDLAENAEAALVLATKQSYDVIFLDVQMPGMDGFELCTKIHKTAANRDTPVVFVTCQSDFGARADSTLCGGNDLIGKPFLAFEITVKALTLALRRRLRQEEALLLASFKKEINSKALMQFNWQSGEFRAAPASDADRPVDEEEVASAFFRQGPADLAMLRELTQALRQTADNQARKETLGDLYLHIHSLTRKADAAEMRTAFQVSSTLAGLLHKLIEKPGNATPSVIRTIVGAVSLFNDLWVRGVKEDLTTEPPIRMLAVDDDPVSRRALVGALQTAFVKPDNADSGEAALTKATEKSFDVIFLDVQMPGMDGFAACSRIHETLANRETPVVFVTGQADLESRRKGVECGSSDFIEKPFLVIEITVKALTFALRGRLQKLAMTQG